MKKILLSTILISSVVSSQLLAADISGDNVRATAGDVFISDYNSPAVKFTDNPSVSTSIDWSIYGFDDKLSVNLGQTSNEVMSLSHDTNALNSLVVNSSGDINLADGSVFIDRSANYMGIGTTAPEEALHVKGQRGNMILEGGSYSKWQIATITGGGFWLKDLLSSSVPFRIDGGAPTNAFHIDGAGNIGIGTSSPQAKLDVRGDIKSTWSGSNTVDDGLTNLLVLSANNSEADKESDAGFGLKNAREDIQWNFRTHQDGTAFVATLAGTGGPEFTVKNATANVSGTELYLGNGAKNVGGVWINASSRALKENIKPLSTKEALTAFNKLQPVTYNYKSDKKEQVVGFIAEDVPELVAINSRDGLSSMDMVAVLTKVVQEQDKMLKVQAEKITKLEAMQKRLAKVESLLTNLALDTSKTTKEKISLK